MHPEGWKRSHLGQHVDMLTGFAFRSEDFGSSGEGANLVRGSNIKRGVLDWSGEIHKTWPIGNGQANIRRYQLQDGDIVLAMDGALVGRSYARIKTADLPAYLVQRVARFRACHGLDQRYLYHLLADPRFSRYVDRVKTDTAIPHISSPDIRAYPVSLPPLMEQARVADILDTLDRQQLQVHSHIDANVRRRGGLAQRLLTGKRRFPEFIDSDAVLETRYGSVPDDWDYVHVGEVAREVNERNGHGNGTAVLSCTKYDGLVDSLEYFGRQVFSDDTSNYKVVRRGQFAYATNHIEEGSIGLLSHRDAGLVSPMYTVFETTDRVHAPFLYALFKTPLYLHLFQVHTDGSINRRGGLRWSRFAEIRVALPSLPEQKKIAATLAAADREIALLRREMDLLRQQKRGLMQKLLTGQVRVKA